MKQQVNYKAILENVLIRCKEQSAYYKEIAYQSEYKDETINRIVDLGIAYNDICQYIELIINQQVEQLQSIVAKATVGDPTTSGANDCTCTCNQPDCPICSAKNVQ